MARHRYEDGHHKEFRMAPESAVLQRDEKRRALRRSRARATGLLVLAVLIFVAVRLVAEPGFGLRLLGTAAEAAIIGGLADWFAVTALFRRPLGLPIPHTALIPARKDEIGRSFAVFVRDQFLDPVLLTERLRRKNRALQLAQWLDSEATARFAAARAVDIVPIFLNSVDDAQIRAFVGKLAQQGLARVDLVRTADSVIEDFVRSGRHMEVVDTLVAVLRPALRQWKEPIIERVSERTGLFFPRYFDRKIGKAIVEGAQHWLRSVRMEGSDERRRLDRWLRGVIADLRKSPDYPRLLAEAQASLAKNPAVLHSLAATWDEIKRELLQDTQSETPKIAATASELVRSAGRLLQQMPVMQDYLNAAIERALVDYIAPWRLQIAKYIAEVIESWDGPKLAETIELQVGRDLQYIRINGTVVGALIGSLLFLIAAAIQRFV
jgi:uncharacterized membrane-anchored protein YjiN (DUF445 family)